MKDSVICFWREGFSFWVRPRIGNDYIRLGAIGKEKFEGKERADKKQEIENIA